MLVPPDAGEELFLKTRRPQVQSTPPFRVGGRGSKQLSKAIEKSSIEKERAGGPSSVEPSWVFCFGNHPCFAKIVSSPPSSPASVIIQPMFPSEIDGNLYVPWNGHLWLSKREKIYPVKMQQEPGGWKILYTPQLEELVQKYNVVNQTARPVSLVTVSAKGDTTWDMVSLESSDLDDVSSVDSLLFPLLKSKGPVEDASSASTSKEGRCRGIAGEVSGCSRSGAATAVPHCLRQDEGTQSNSTGVRDACSTCSAMLGSSSPPKPRSTRICEPSGTTSSSVSGSVLHHPSPSVLGPSDLSSSSTMLSVTHAPLPSHRDASCSARGTTPRMHHSAFVLRKVPRHFTCAVNSMSSPSTSSPATSLQTESPSSAISMASVDHIQNRFPSQSYKMKLAPRAHSVSACSTEHSSPLVACNGSADTGLPTAVSGISCSPQRGQRRYTPVLAPASVSAAASPFSSGASSCTSRSASSPLQSLLMDSCTEVLPHPSCSPIPSVTGNWRGNAEEDVVRHSDTCWMDSAYGTQSEVCSAGQPGSPSRPCRPLGGIAFEGCGSHDAISAACLSRLGGTPITSRESSNVGGILSTHSEIVEYASVDTLPSVGSAAVSIASPTDTSLVDTPAARDAPSVGPVQDTAKGLIIDSSVIPCVENGGNVDDEQVGIRMTLLHDSTGRERAVDGCIDGSPTTLDPPKHGGVLSCIHDNDSSNSPTANKQSPALCRPRDQSGTRGGDATALPDAKRRRESGANSSRPAPSVRHSRSCNKELKRMCDDFKRPKRRRSSGNDYAHRDAFFGSWPTRKQAASEGTWKV